MHPILLHLGAWSVHAYGLALAVAFFAGAWLGARRATRSGLDPLHVLVVAALSFVAAVAGARLLSLAIERPAELANPGAWLRIQEGGLIFYGGFAAALGSSALYCLAARVPFLLLADTVAPSLALGHGIVRIGCFLNGCCYGKPASWGVVLPSLGDGLPRQPTQLYEAAAGFALCAVLLALDGGSPAPASRPAASRLIEARPRGARPAPTPTNSSTGPELSSTRPRRGSTAPIPAAAHVPALVPPHPPTTTPLPGMLIFLYVGAYGAIRFLLEFARDDDRGPRLLGLTVSQVVGLAALTVGVIGLRGRRAGHRGPSAAAP